MLKQRLIVASILAPLTILAILKLPPFALELLIAGVTLLAVREFLALFKLRNRQRIFFFSTMGVFISFTLTGARWPIMPSDLIAALYTIMFVNLGVILLGVLFWIAAIYFLGRYQYHGRYRLTSPLLTGYLIFLPFWSSMWLLINYLHVVGKGMLMFLLLIVWTSDIGGYFVGKFCGRHKLATQISPNKTVEGVLGAIFLSSLVTWFVIPFLFGSMTKSKLILLMLLSLVVSLFAVIGDLFESMLKREAGVKDSGKMLPGHGGLYDRIDGLLASAPVLAMGFFVISII